MKDFRVNKSIVAGLNDDKFLWAIIEPFWPSSDKEDSIKYISQGSKGRQALFSITLFIREVDNGGLEQFLSNTSGQYINMVLTGLNLINASEQLEALKEAITIFPDCVIPLDRNKRNKVLIKQLETHNTSFKEYFEKFNNKLYGEERLTPLLLKYIRNNESEFFKD